MTMSALLRFFKNNNHLIIAITVAVCVYGILLSELRFFRSFIPTLQQPTAYLLVWDSFLLTYLILVGLVFGRVSQSQIQEQAHQEYEKRTTMLVLICTASIISIITIIQEMRIGADASGWLAGFHIGLTMFTLVLSWLFIHILFALYYAHGYYDSDNNDHYPLDFPYESKPDYWDFVYFSLGIGATGQTADISFTGRKLRRIGAFHSVLSFFFNTAVLALMIEMSASLIAI